MPDSRREQLRAELVRLRMLASIGRRPMGDAIKATHGTVRRIEIGETLPKVQHVRLWLDRVAEADRTLVDAATRQHLLDLVEAAHIETRGWDELLSEEGHAQREIGRREQAATMVRNYQDEIVPGLLQTPEYARAYFELGHTRDVDAAVSARLERQKVLRAPGRRFVFLIAERALSWPLGGAEVLAEQRDRVASLSRLPTVEIAVVPPQAVVTIPWHNFTLWDTPDGPYALAETMWGQREASTPAELETAEARWQLLWGAAVHGEAALDLIRQG